MFSALNATGKQHQSKLQQTKLCLAPLYECLFAFITKVNSAFYAVAVEANASSFNFEQRVAAATTTGADSTAAVNRMSAGRDNAVVTKDYDIPIKNKSPRIGYSSTQAIDDNSH
ncbi:hypothetical protein GQX74_015538 [Glossina fuscipes]|nr:hypothetical protein GQX74_015538 [Glossina fuscipes]